MCRIRPPSHLGLARLSTLVALRKKKDSPPPPPPSSAFLGLARLSRLAAVRKKTVCCAPPFFSWIRPCEGGWREWLMYLIKLFQVIHLISIFYKSLSIFLQLHCGIKVVFVKKTKTGNTHEPCAFLQIPKPNDEESKIDLYTYLIYMYCRVCCNQ